MNNPLFIGIFAAATLYFGFLTLLLFPTLIRLIAALRRGAVKWPGPIVRDPDPQAAAFAARIGARPAFLFPTSTQYTLGLGGAFVFSLLILLSAILLDVVFLERRASCLTILTIAALPVGWFVSRRANHHMSQVKDLLSDLSGDAEPRQVDGRSAESEYAIEHPLMIHQAPLTDAQVALNLYHSAMTYLREGDRMQGNLLNQEALRKDPSLHKRACEKLSAMAQGCSPAEAGPIYYWLGIHFENRRKFKEAIAGYNKAALAFEHLGYQKRQGRALCNLGTVYLKLGDYDHGIEQFEKAIALNPNDGIAHFNIGMIYYRISSPGEENHDRALDSFAAAIAADPEAYGTAITTRMRAHAYEWEEDLSEVLRRVEMKKQLAARDSSGKSISG